MNLKYSVKIAFLVPFFVISFTTNAEKLEPTIKVALAAGALCKIYAQEIGGDVNAFSEMNKNILLIADKMGHTKNLNSYLTEVRLIKEAFDSKLIEEHKTKLNVYNNWCIKFHDGIVDENNKWY